MIFLSTLALRDQSKWRANKSEHGEKYIMLIRMLVLKIINNERKFLTRHKIIDRIGGQIVLVTTRVCKKSMRSSKLAAVECPIYLFIQVYLPLLCRCMDLKKEILFKKIRNHSQPLKLQQHISIFHKFS